MKFLPSWEYKKVKKKITMSSANENAIFLVTGLVNVSFIFGKVTEVTDSTAAFAVGLFFRSALGDETIVDNSGPPSDWTACQAGGYAVRIGIGAPFSIFGSPSWSGGSVGHPGEKPQQIILAGTGTESIVLKYTGDANTDIDVEFTIIYQALSPDGKIVIA